MEWNTVLSHDVLYHLFMKCMQIDSRRNTPVVLSHICRSWRYTALNTATLWTKIDMQCVRGNQTHPWVQARLARSRNAPITFRIRATRHFSQFELHHIIEPNAHRFQRFSVTANAYRLAIFVWNQLHIQTPCLETMQVFGGGELLFSVGWTTPGHVFATGMPFCVPPRPRHDILWNQWDVTNVTSLTFKYMNPELRPILHDLLYILQMCQRTLIHLEFLGLAPSMKSDSHGPLSTVILPALQSLSIGYVDNMAPVFGYIVSPNLSSFTLRDCVRSPESAIEHVWSDDPLPPCQLDLILEHACNFKRIINLSLYGLGMCALDSIFRFYTAMKGLRSFTVYNCHEYITSLLGWTSADIVFPSLKEYLTTDASSLLRFVDRQMANGVRLDKLMVAKTSLSLENLRTFDLIPMAKVVYTIIDPYVGEYRPLLEEVVAKDGAPVFVYGDGFRMSRRH